MATEGISTAVPKELAFPPPSLLHPGITSEEISILPYGNIPNPTPAGTEIQIIIPKYEGTFLDPQSSYLTCNVTLSLVNNGANTIYENDINGYIMGSFWSLFARYSVYANNTNLTDDILEIGIAAYRLLKLTMDHDARQASSVLYGFNCDPDSYSGIAGFRVIAPFPFSADQDNITGNRLFPNATGNNGVITSFLTCGSQILTTGAKTQRIDFALPLFGSLGVQNDNLYYLGLGPTRISLITANSSDFYYSPAAQKTVQQYVGTGAAANTQYTIYGGNVGLTSYTFNTVRFNAVILKVSADLWPSIYANFPIQQKIINRCKSVTVSTTQIPQGSQGSLQPLFLPRKASMNLVLCHFNNTGVASIAGAAITNEVKPFGKFSSINPGLGANTALVVNNVMYPKLGINTLDYPSQAEIELFRCLGVMNTSVSKPAVLPQNFRVADPVVCAGGATSTSYSQYYRTGAYATDNQANSILDLWTMQSPTNVGVTFPGASGLPKFTCSNDFILAIDLDQTSRPGYISGVSTTYGSSYFNMTLPNRTSYAYTIYFICVHDEILIFDFAANEVRATT